LLDGIIDVLAFAVRLTLTMSAWLVADRIQSQSATPVYPPFDLHIWTFVIAHFSGKSAKLRAINRQWPRAPCASSLGLQSGSQVVKST
jgi:hypothetical protein